MDVSHNCYQHGGKSKSYEKTYHATYLQKLHQKAKYPQRHQVTGSDIAVYRHVTNTTGTLLLNKYIQIA